jgi:methylenetetrahydrofolate reductase (NADPH)
VATWEAQAERRNQKLDLVAALIAAASVELSPRDGLDAAALRALLPAGTTVFVNHPPRATHHDIVAACTRLRRAGLVPVPHLAARRLSSFTQLDDLLRRAAAEAAIERALIIAGDPERSLGPFRDSLDLLAGGAVERHGLAEVSFAVYPERHPRIDDRALDAALDAKLELARRRGLKPSLVTQFGFAAAPIWARIAALRARNLLSDRDRHRRARQCRHPRQIRDPLRRRRLAAGAGPRRDRNRARPDARHPRRADPGPRRRRSAGGADRRPAHLHLRRPAPDRPVAPRPARTGRLRG